MTTPWGKIKILKKESHGGHIPGSGNSCHFLEEDKILKKERCLWRFMSTQI